MALLTVKKVGKHYFRIIMDHLRWTWGFLLVVSRVAYHCRSCRDYQNVLTRDVVMKGCI